MAQTASPADITAVQDLLKEVYPNDQVVSQMYEDALLLSQIEQTTEYHDAVGDKAIGFVKVGRNVGTSARSLNGGTLGAAGHQQVDRWELDYAANYLQLKILGTTIAKMKTARQAAVREVDFEVTEGINDLKKEVQRQLYGNGDALLAQAATTTASASVALVPWDNASNFGDGWDQIKKGNIQVGEYLDIGTTADEDAVVADAKVVSVTESASAPVVTIDSAVTTTTAHYLSKADNRSGTTSYEMNGLRNLVSDTGTFAGINSSTVPLWKSYVYDAAGANLSRAMMQTAWRRNAQKGSRASLILTSLEQQEAYYNLLQSQVRFSGDSNLGSGKVDGPTFNNMAVVADPDCPSGDMFFLDKRSMFIVSAGDIAWQNTTSGGDILDWVQGEDAFAARAAFYANIGTTKRAAHARIKNLNVATS